MTGDKMKSDCKMDSRYRSEGRPSLPRRRVATKTSHENGDFEMELSLAIKESLKYAKEKEGQLKGVDKTSPLLNGVKSDESFSRMAGKMLTFATSSDQGQGSEVQQLKDLLLIHIELIQHQQEQLSNKEKEIRILRNEKDTLQCRLQKVEKRLAQLKQKEDVLEAQIANAKSVAVVQEVTAVPEQPEKNKLITKAEQPPSRKRVRQPRKVQPKKQKRVKKLSVAADKASESVTSEEEADAEESDSAEEEEEDGENEDKDDDEASDIEGEEDSGREDKSSEDSTDENKNRVKEEVEEVRDPHPEPVLRTDCMYHVSCCVELPPEETVEPNDEKEVVTGEEVETPGWRINVLTNRYQLEGTENITDEAYQKRHQKHEVEERRRKRWDIQRMREQKVFEKLRGKEEMATSSTQTDQSFKTLLPSFEDLTHVEISDHIAVMAFGQAVPHIEPSEFELPWDTGPASSYTRKSHGGRGRQK